MDFSVKPRIVFPGGTKFGTGRAELLRRIGEEGSLNRAVQAMGMSYRAAWGYVQELEEAAGFAFLDRSGAGARLTPEAEQFLAAYEAFRKRVAADAEEAFAAEFPDE